jgi:hypothetical protein
VDAKHPQHPQLQILSSSLLMILGTGKLDVLGKRKLKHHISMHLQKKVYDSRNIIQEAQCARLQGARF